MKAPFHHGQRWISDTEPELGLGSVTRASRLTVALTLGASGEKREYAKDNAAPPRRVRFRAGDTVKHRDGPSVAITSLDPLRKAHDIAGARVPGLIRAARLEMGARLDHEIARLRELRR